MEKWDDVVFVQCSRVMAMMGRFEVLSSRGASDDRCNSEMATSRASSLGGGLFALLVGISSKTHFFTRNSLHFFTGHFVEP